MENTEDRIVRPICEAVAEVQIFQFVRGAVPRTGTFNVLQKLRISNVHLPSSTRERRFAKTFVFFLYGSAGRCQNLKYSAETTAPHFPVCELATGLSSSVYCRMSGCHAKKRGSNPTRVFLLSILLFRRVLAHSRLSSGVLVRNLPEHESGGNAPLWRLPFCRRTRGTFHFKFVGASLPR